jgi:hypothetical protein
MVRIEVGAANPGTPRHAPSAFMRSVKLLLIVVTFAVLGPVVGTIVFVAELCLRDVAPLGYQWVFSSGFKGLVTGMSHFIGGIPAAIAGVMIGIKEVWFGGAGWLFALGVGALAGTGLEFLVTRLPHERLSPDGSLFVVATLSTLACWGMMKTFVNKADP